MRTSRPHTSSGSNPSEHPLNRHIHRNHAIPNRPSTSSGVPDPTTNQRPVSIVVTSPFAGVAPVPPFADFMPNRRRSAKKRKEGVPPSRPHAVADLPKKDAHFSTADRTILNELRLGAAARDSQFKMKAGKKHHVYPTKAAPYPLNYERPVIDHDVWETMFLQQLSGSLTFHVFDTPPTKVLDLGCGSAYWILECAKQWRNCEFVGLDLVPLHPDLSLLRSSDLGSRITWVQANCLEGLPFPNEEFDFVHIKRLAHGIPEDRWDFLLEEISRVMKPGAAIEMIEEDLFFPGRFLDPPPQPRSTTPFTTNGLYHDTNDRWSLSQDRSTSTSASASYNPYLYPPSLTSGIGTASTSTLPVSIHDTDTLSSLDSSNRLSSDSSRREPGSPLNPRDHSLLEHIYTGMHAARFINLSPLSQLAHSLPLYFENVRSHAPIMFMFPPPDLARVQGQLFSGDTSHSDGELKSAQPSLDKPGSVTMISGRLHQVQQYVLMDESAVAPGIKTARQKATPTTTSRPLPTTTSSTGTLTKIGFPPISSPTPSEASLLSEERSTTTSTTAYTHAVGGDTNIPNWFNTLPNQRLQFDLQSLNLHLSMRITEVLACAEAMWEWVCGYQDTRSRHGQPQMSKVNSHSRPTAGNTDRFNTELVGMSRSEFDVLLTRFEFDMHDCINMNSRITSALHTPIPTFARTSDRKAFDDACEKWDEYQMKQRARRMPRPASKKGSDLSAAESLDFDDLEAAGPARQRLSRTFRVFCAWKAS